MIVPFKSFLLSNGISVPRKSEYEVHPGLLEQNLQFSSDGFASLEVTFPTLLFLDIILLY